MASKRDWNLFDESSLMLRTALKKEQSGERERHSLKLKKAIVENNLIEICEVLERGEHHHLNKLWKFSLDNFTLHVPPLCAAVCLRNLPMVQCLLHHGADPDRVGRLYIHRQKPVVHRWTKVTPLMMAVEHHPDEGLPFVAAVASALVDAGADINSTACNFNQEEEEEGGSMTYRTPDTLLHKCVDVGSQLDRDVFYFVLDHGADMLIKDSRNGYTALQKCLHWLAECPEDENLGVYAEELICRGGFTTYSMPGESPVTYGFAFRLDKVRSEFKFLLKAMTKVARRRKLMSKIQRMLHLLFDAGYHCSKSDVSRYKAAEIKNVDEVLAERICGVHVYSLKHFSRLKIRQNVQDLRCLDSLSLPVSLIRYLKLKREGESR